MSKGKEAFVAGLTERVGWRDRIAPFAQHIHEINGKIFHMPDEELKALVNACKKVTPTNCGWAEYEVAPLLAGLVRAELGRRRLSGKARGKRKRGQ